MSSSQTPPSSPNSSSDFFLRLSREKVETPQPVRKSTRIVTGLTMGVLLGLVYALVTQFINSIFSPDVPFALYPFGLAGNIVASLVIWGVVGVLCAWPDSSITGAVVGCLTTSAAVIMFALVAAPPTTESVMTQFFSTSASLFSFLVFALLNIPLMLLVRLAIDVQGELALQSLWSWRRLRAPLASFLLLGVVMSVLTLYDPNVRQAMVDMHVLIQKGRAVSDAAHLPSALRSVKVNDFLAHAGSNYTLEHTYDERYQRDLATVLDSGGIVIVARFQNGWILACQFDLKYDMPLCKSYEPPLQASKTLVVVSARPK
jgi:hypothetical protein